jgi:hypothetical protein
MFFVEGDDDQRFIERIVAPRIGAIYPVIKYFRYASSVPKETCQILRTLESTGWDYIFLADRDQCVCKTIRRQRVCDKMQAVKFNKVVIVDQEIESWYVSGIDVAIARAFGVPRTRCSELFTKEHLNRSINRRFPTATDLKLFLLDNFSLELAKQNNDSLSYLCRRLEI